MAGNQPRQLTKPYPDPGAPCRHGDITNHAIGQYCAICTRIKMPWGGFLPIARYQGVPVTVGQTGTILQAVQVNSPREISLVVMATWAIMNNKWSDAILINRGIELGRIKAAAHALADIALMAMQKPEFAEVKWWDILHEALKDPELTLAGYKTRIRGPDTVPTGSRLRPQNSKPIVSPEVDDDGEQEDEDLGYDDTDKIPEGKKLLFLSRDEIDEYDDDDDDDEYEVVDQKTERKISPWQFIHGQDLEPAYWATPDASKFFMVRQLRKDPNKINVREYPQIAGFDWNDKEAVQALNRGRNQIILRTNGAKAPPRLAWSQIEKDLLRHQVIQGLRNGYTKNTMPWEQVAHNINVDLEGVTQKRGSILARPSKWNSRTNQEEYNIKRHLTMLRDRTGSNRQATGCMNQATRFGDIDALLRNSVEKSSRRKTLDEMLKIVHDAHHHRPLLKTGTAPTSTRAAEMQLEDGGGSLGDDSPEQNDRMQTGSANESSDDEPLMKRRKSYHAVKKTLGGQTFTKRRCSKQGQ